MRRTDAVLIVVVGALGVFVASQFLTRRPMPKPRPPVAAAPQAPAANTPVTPAGQPSPAPDSTQAALASVHGDMSVATVKSATPAPARDMALIKALIAETPGTYMADMLPDLDGHLVRWPDRRQEGLRIWVQTTTPIANWDERYAQMARDAFDDWGRDSELPLRFDFVLDSASSDIRIVWSDRFPRCSASAWAPRGARRTNTAGWLPRRSRSRPTTARDTRFRRPPSRASSATKPATRLASGHSRDQRTKMFPTEMVSDIRAADRATLRLLYRLPPGLAR